MRTIWCKKEMKEAEKVEVQGRFMWTNIGVQRPRCKVISSMKNMVGGDLFIKLGFARWINVFFSGQSIGRFACDSEGETTSLKSFSRANKHARIHKNKVS